MGIFDGLGGKKGRDFTPVCHMDPEDKTIVCKPEKKVSGGDTMVPKYGEMRFQFDGDSNRIILLDDGGAPQELIDDITDHLKKRYLRR